MKLNMTDINYKLNYARETIKIANKLLALANKRIAPESPRCSICSICAVCPMSLIRDIIVKWPKWSGSRMYPVPHPVYGPIKAYYNHDNLWGDNEYGNNRRELAAFIGSTLINNVGEIYDASLLSYQITRKLVCRVDVGNQVGNQV